MFTFRPFLLAAVISAALPFVAVHKVRAQEKTGDYRSVVEQIRAAKGKIAADSRDIYPLIGILQGEQYPKAVEEAARRGDDAALLELYQAKHAEYWPRTVKGTPLLSYAAMSGDAPTVRRLIARGADVKAVNAENWTALHHAAEDGNVKIVQMLLDRGADVNAPTARFAETPLMLACGLYGGGRRSTVCARLLIERGAGVNAQTKDGETALTCAARQGALNLVRLLLAKNADATLKDFKGNTALSEVEEFTRIDSDNKIAYTQDSKEYPVYKLTVFEALIRHGKARPGLYVSPEVEKQVEKDGLNDFLTIYRVLQKAQVKQEKPQMR